MPTLVLCVAYVSRACAVETTSASGTTTGYVRDRLRLVALEAALQRDTIVSFNNEQHVEQCVGQLHHHGHIGERCIRDGTLRQLLIEASTQQQSSAASASAVVSSSSSSSSSMSTSSSPSAAPSLPHFDRVYLDYVRFPIGYMREVYSPSFVPMLRAMVNDGLVSSLTEVIMPNYDEMRTNLTNAGFAYDEIAAQKYPLYAVTDALQQRVATNDAARRADATISTNADDEEVRRAFLSIVNADQLAYAHGAAPFLRIRWQDPTHAAASTKRTVKHRHKRHKASDTCAAASASAATDATASRSSIDDNCAATTNTVLDTPHASAAASDDTVMCVAADDPYAIIIAVVTSLGAKLSDAITSQSSRIDLLVTEMSAQCDARDAAIATAAAVTAAGLTPDATFSAQSIADWRARRDRLIAAIAQGRKVQHELRGDLSLPAAPYAYDLTLMMSALGMRLNEQCALRDAASLYTLARVLYVAAQHRVAEITTPLNDADLAMQANNAATAAANTERDNMLASIEYAHRPECVARAAVFETDISDFDKVLALLDCRLANETRRIELLYGHHKPANCGRIFFFDIATPSTASATVTAAWRAAVTIMIGNDEIAIVAETMTAINGRQMLWCTQLSAATNVASSIVA